MSDKRATERSTSPWKMAWDRFRKDRLGLSAIFFIGLVAMVAILGAIIRPDQTPDANDQHLALGKKKPGFEVLMLEVANRQEEPDYWFEGLFFGGFEKENRTIPISEFKIQGEEILYRPYTGAIDESMRWEKLNLARVLYPLADGEAIEREGERLSFNLKGGEEMVVPISDLQSQVREAVFEKRFFLGTDKFGRDLLSRLMAGAIVSLSVGFISVAISLLIGLSLGAIAGYFRGWIDDLIMWLINVIWSIPTLLMVIAITFALGKGFTQVFIAVGLTMWVEVARVVRGQVIAIKENEFVEASRALGFRPPRIIFNHLLPNVISPVIVISAANFASAILLEAGLSFLGIGAQIPMPSWGQMIKEHYAFITTDLAYLAILPGLCIVSLVLAFMLIGNALRDALDVKSRLRTA